MKHRLAAAGLGVLAAALVFVFMNRVSLDMRWVFLLGGVALFAAGLWLGSSPGAGIWTWLLLCLPLVGAFGYVALREFTPVWPHLLLWAIAGAAGLAVSRVFVRRPVLAAAAVLALAGGSVWYTARYLPAVISRALTHVRNEPAPAVALRDLDGRPIDTAAWKGKVVVLDFFSTWCAPCVAEMPPLQAARDQLGSRPDFVFLVVANDSGGDTPDSVRAFAARRGIRMPFAWDPGSFARKAFGFTGLPALAVLDRTGRIRLTHEGYNAADVNFREDLKRFATGL
jgi:thiol-disulfide isomerase/thioredoxin